MSSNIDNSILTPIKIPGKRYRKPPAGSEPVVSVSKLVLPLSSTDRATEEKKARTSSKGGNEETENHGSGPDPASA